MTVYDGAQCEILIRSWLQFLAKVTNRPGLPVETISNQARQVQDTARRLSDTIFTLGLAGKQEWMKTLKPERHINAFHNQPTTLEDWGIVTGGDQRIADYTAMDGDYASDRQEETILRKAYVIEERVARSRNFVVAKDFVAGETPLPPGVARERNELRVEEGMILFHCVQYDIPHWYYCTSILFEDNVANPRVGDKGLIPRSHVYLPGKMPEDRAKKLKRKKKEWRKKVGKKKEAEGAAGRGQGAGKGER